MIHTQREKPRAAGREAAARRHAPLIGAGRIDPEQAWSWFWTLEWQPNEHEMDDDLTAGRWTTACDAWSR
jgi:hypothetical protein